MLAVMYGSSIPAASRVHEMTCIVRTPKSEPDDPADDADRKALDQDEGEDARRPPADRRQDAQLEGPLVDRHQHGVGDRQDRGDQNDRRRRPRPSTASAGNIGDCWRTRSSSTPENRWPPSPVAPALPRPGRSRSGRVNRNWKSVTVAFAPEQLLQPGKRDDGNILVEHRLEGGDADDGVGLELQLDGVAEFLAEAPSARSRRGRRS